MTMTPLLLPGPDDVDTFLTPRVSYLIRKDAASLTTHDEREAIAAAIRERGGQVPGTLYDTLVDDLSRAKSAIMRYYALDDPRVSVSGASMTFTT